jgi:hypothetical protein
MSTYDSEPLCECDSLHRLAEEPGSPLRFNEASRYFFLAYESDSRLRHEVLVKYCFFCGKLASRERRERGFHHITKAEQLRLVQLTAGITSLDEARARLGPPDSDFPAGLISTQPETSERGAVTECFRAFVYANLSSAAFVRIIERRDGSARIAFEAKPAPKDAS